MRSQKNFSKKNVQTIETNIYSFNTPKLPAKLKISYTVVNVDAYITNLLRNLGTTKHCTQGI